MNKKNLLNSFFIFLQIFFVILIYSAWDLIKINNSNDYGGIIFHLLSLFCFYLIGVKYSKKYIEISRFFFLITSLQFVYGFSFVDQLFLKLICFLVILRIAFITKNFELQCGTAIIYFQIIASLLGGLDLFGISLALINIILISSSSYFAKIIPIIAETLLVIIVMIMTNRTQEVLQEINSIDIISVTIIIINFIALIILFLKSQDKLEKKSLLCFAILMPVFFIPHKIIMLIGFCIFSFIFTTLMIFRKRMHAGLILIIYSILMVLISAFSSIGRGGSKLTGNEFIAFKFLIIVAFCAQLYAFYKRKMLKKNQNLKLENNNSIVENSKKIDYK